MEQLIYNLVNNASSKYSRIKCDNVTQFGNKYYNITITGGLNGHGKSRDYLSDLLDVVDNLEDHFENVIISQYNIDVLDDVFVVGIVVDSPIN